MAVVIYALGTTSGAHINPAVTISLAATGRFPWREVGPYVAAQIRGSVLGSALIVGASAWSPWTEAMSAGWRRTAAGRAGRHSRFSQVSDGTAGEG